MTRHELETFRELVRRYEKTCPNPATDGLLADARKIIKNNEPIVIHREPDKRWSPWHEDMVAFNK